MAPVFDAPGQGQWALDRSHYPSCVTPISQWLLRHGMRGGLAKVFEELGLPLESVTADFVNGFMYTRMRPLIGADDKPRKPPPAAVLKLASRLHPAFRKRNKAATATLRDRPSNEVVRRWDEELRPQLEATNNDFQAFDVEAANDVELQAHITSLLDHLHSSFNLHFWLHGHDLGPIARYLNACLGWGLDPVQAISALAGASPTTAAPAKTLCRLRELLESCRVPVTSLDDLVASSDEAKTLISDYLDQRGHVLATGYDLDARTLVEMPDTVLRSIRAASEPPTHNTDGIIGDLRNQVVAPQRPTFDLFLGDARRVMDMRDDNGPLTIEWPMGLLRRALLAAGDRLVERSAILMREHLFDVTPDEARALFDGSLPSSSELDNRALARAARARLDPPALLGDPEPEPPLDVLPKPLAELTAMVQVAMQYLSVDGRDAVGEPLAGAGIGTQRYVGIARVAASADEALDRLEPGDILVVRATTPAFNVVLNIAGAVVTSDGGVLSHAAVLSRELGIPAVIGASGALDIVDGSTIEVDAAAGLVRLV